MNAPIAVSNGKPPTVISTFAGCGGSSLGYHQAGFHELLVVEWDNHAVETFKANFPEVNVYHGDIANLSVEDCLSRAGLKPGELDLFDGSPPCQGFSIVARAKAGKAQHRDPRNKLFEEFCRLLKGLQPKTFVMENVTGLIAGDNRQTYLEILRQLRACGYRVKGEVLNAKFYGVPQARRRVIIIGVREDFWKEPSHPSPQTKPMTASEAIKDLPLDEIIHFKRGTLRKLWALTKPGNNFQKAHPNNNAFNQHKAHPDKPFTTILRSCGINGGNGQAHWDVPGQLSIRMVKRACGFPDDFILPGKFTQQWARLGNSVPPPLTKAIALHIKTEILAHV